MRHPPPAIAIRLDDEKTEQVRRNHEQRLQYVESLPQILALGEFSLADGVQRTIPHKLGRSPVMVIVSPVRGATAAGYINEIRSTSLDRAKFIVLQADDFGGTVSVDVAVLA